MVIDARESTSGADDLGKAVIEPDRRVVAAARALVKLPGRD